MCISGVTRVGKVGHLPGVPNPKIKIYTRNSEVVFTTKKKKNVAKRRRKKNFFCLGHKVLPRAPNTLVTPLMCINIFILDVCSWCVHQFTLYCTHEKQIEGNFIWNFLTKGGFQVRCEAKIKWTNVVWWKKSNKYGSTQKYLSCES